MATFIFEDFKIFSVLSKKIRFLVNFVMFGNRLKQGRALWDWQFYPVRSPYPCKMLLESCNASGGKHLLLGSTGRHIPKTAPRRKSVKHIFLDLVEPISVIWKTFLMWNEALFTLFRMMCNSILNVREVREESTKKCFTSFQPSWDGWVRANADFSPLVCTLAEKF